MEFNDSIFYYIKIILKIINFQEIINYLQLEKIINLTDKIKAKK